MVFLRGEVETREQIDALLHGGEGVEAARNLMHLPGEPAPA